MRPAIRSLVILIMSVLSGIIFMNSCKESHKEKDKTVDQIEQTEENLYRPNFHFTPKSNWMNDPNGMFYMDGQYHLFFQYYPYDTVWGPMHWGHAVSKDMIIWEEKGIALYPDSLGYIFSGSAVVDHKNSSGLGSNNQPPVIAIFTYHDPIGAEEERIDFQYQGIAYSNDKGLSWNKFDDNPVLPNPGIRDFRDPKVIWDENSNQWVMALAVDYEVQFFGSEDLKSWHYLSSFGKNFGAHGGVWECPDLFPLTVGNSETEKWVLLLSLNPGGPNGGSATQYFIGDFDGKNFILDSDFEAQLEEAGAVWLDYGRDNYAGVTWSNIPEEDGRRLFMGWMSNWDYAQLVPTEKWRSAMTVARKLSLDKKGNRFLLKSFPAEEMMQHFDLLSETKNAQISAGEILPGTENIELNKLRIDLTLKKNAGSQFVFSLNNKDGDELLLGYDHVNGSFFIDRRNSGNTAFSEKFAPSVTRAPFNWISNELDMTIVLDKTSVELFVDKGELVMTEIFFPNRPLTDFVTKDLEGMMEIEQLQIYSLKD